MTRTNRQQTTPIMIDSIDSDSVDPLISVPLSENFISEGILQNLLAKFPNLIPINEIEPALGPLIFLGMEVPTNSGPIDLLFVSPSGYLTIVETKLWRNPEARRKVVGQLIDYAKEIAGWSYEELKTAIQRAKRPEGGTAGDIMDIIDADEHDIDEVSFIDIVTRNLHRGHFLLIIAGDGIREDVESMGEYLQGNPSLHFTFALLELALFRIKPSQDYPLLVQPRLVARTAEVVRAIVDVRSSPPVVTIPADGNKTGLTRRKTLTEKNFYSDLALKTNEKTSQAVSHLALKLSELGVEPTWRASSVSFRFPDPRDTGQDFTTVIITTDGKFWVGYIGRIKDAGYDLEIGIRYLHAISELTGIEINKKSGKTARMDLVKLIDVQEGFLGLVKKFVDELTYQAKRID